MRASRTGSPSRGDRKGFSGILQRVSGEEGRGDIRKVDGIRSESQSDKSPSKETKALHTAPAQTKRPDASPSRTAESHNTIDGEGKTTEEPRTNLELPAQQSDAGNGSQDQAAPLSTMVSFQTASDPIDLATIPTTDLHSTGDEAEREPDSSRSPLSSLVATTDSSAKAFQTAEDGPSPAGAGIPLHALSEQKSAMPPSEQGRDSRAVPIADQGPHLVAEPGGVRENNRADNPSALGELHAEAALPPHDSIDRRAVQSSPETIPSDGQLKMTKTDSAPKEGISLASSAPGQVDRYAPEHEDLRAKTGAASQAQPPRFDAAEHFSDLLSDQGDRQQDNGEKKLPQAEAAELRIINGQMVESFAGGSHSQNVSGSMGTAPAVSVAHRPAMPTPDTAEPSAHVMTRSVVFDVAQPDLGHVNIRVMMTNDVVHTHLSADRPDVGQFLINGQDRLQAAFQANGLDMGQFRVDIDRQGAGRSFQHGPSQEQGHTWNDGAQEMTWGQRSDRQDEPRTSLHGLLNVVA